MAIEKTKVISLRVSEEDYQRYRDAMIDQRCTNMSQFVRDAIEEKIEFWRETQEEVILDKFV